jgi:endo-1,4-beta-D-glucanase Y
MGHRYLVVVPCALLVACASPKSTEPGPGVGGSGAPSSSGHAGTTGTTGAAGSSGAGAGFGTGGPFAFPQNKASGMCKLTTVANAASATMAAYNSWKSTYVTSSGAPSGALRVVNPQTVVCDNNVSVTSGTVSEGMGYGMLAAVYMNDQPTFDKLLAYVNAHLDAKGLMNWCLDGGGTVKGAYSATDGDEDMIWALLMASDQWSSTAYLTTAKTMIDVMKNYSLFSDGTLQNGDNWNTSDNMHTDYFSPAYYRVFGKATNDIFWSQYVVDANYAHLAAVSGNDGLVPDASNLEDSLQTSASCPLCVPNYGYDACRMPWRIAMDYCFNNEPRALTYLQKIGGFFNTSVSGNAASIGDGYSQSGSKTSGNTNMAFIGPVGVAGMAGWPMLVDSAFNFGVSNPGNGNDAYFPQSLRVVTMLMMSGNFLDYTKQQ